jgi:hypothetical protein
MCEKIWTLPGLLDPYTPLFFFAVGVLLSNLVVIASGVAGPAVSYALGQGATLVAAIY